MSKTKHKLKRALQLATELSHVLGLVAKTRWVALTAVGLEVVKTGFKIHEELSYGRGDTQAYFINDWNLVPIVLHDQILQIVEDSRMVMKSYYTGDNHPNAHEGKIQNIKIGWLATEKTDKPKYMYVEKGREADLYEMCSESLWRLLSTKHIAISNGTLKSDDLTAVSTYRETQFVKDLLSRIKSFDGEKSRSYMIIGPPGSGKSCAIRSIVKSLDLRSLTIPFQDISSGIRNPGDVPPESFLQLLKPSIIVMNDFDRLDEWLQNNWLDRLEKLRENSKIILFSVNDPSKLSNAIKRVDRIDDHIVIPPTGETTAALIIGPSCAEHVKMMADWPIAFVCEYAKRVKALGKDAADRELPELQKRVLDTVRNPGS